MKEQIQDLQIKLNALIDAQKKMPDAQQKATPAKGTAQVVSGSDKIKLAISGQIDRGVPYFDDGAENNLFNVDNGNSTTRIRTLDARDDPTNYYGKLGYQAAWFSFGKTAIAAEYGRTFDLTDNGDDGQVFGFQLLQNVDDWAMEIFAAYRHFHVDQGNGFDVNDADLLFAGSRVKF